MYPTFSDLLKDLTGFNILLPIQMFGLMVALAFVAAHYAITSELRRHSINGNLKSHFKSVTIGLPASKSELIINGIFGFIISYKLFYLFFNYAAFNADPQDALLSLKGYFIGGVLGAAGMVYWTYLEKKKQQLPQPITKQIEVFPYQLMGNITVIAAVCGIIGSKIFHNLENWDQFIQDPVGSMISFSGFTFYGGLICGFAGIIYYAKKKNLGIGYVIDSAAPGLLLGYGIGRLGCHLAGDGDWGIVSEGTKPNWLSFLPDWMWSFKFPHNVISEGIPIPGCVGRHCNELPFGVYPTSFYESMVAILLFFVLWSLRKRITMPGILFSIYLMMNGLERFFIEKIRVNNLYHVSGMAFTQAELISSMIFLIGVVSAFYFYYQSKKTHATERAN